MADMGVIRFRILQASRDPWWWRVAYLIIDIFRQHPELERGVEHTIVGKDEGFNKFLTAQVQAYLERGATPAPTIAAPIINLAEDVTTGREPTLRAGDYIALQTAYRAQAKT